MPLPYGMEYKGEVEHLIALAMFGAQVHVTLPAECILATALPTTQLAA